MSKERTMDTRIDPTSLTVHPVVLTESYKVMALPGLPGRYGFVLCELPCPRDAEQSYVSLCYRDEEGVEHPMMETDISTQNLHINQFCVNYGDLASERPFRMGQVFTNKLLENFTIIAVYSGLGDSVHAGASFPPPVGGTYTQYAGLKGPEQLFSGTVWQPYHELFPQYAGVFMRLLGGHALPFDEEGTQNPQAYTAGGGSHTHSVTYGKVATVGASLFVATDVGTAMATGSGALAENRPINMSVVLWVRLH